MKPISFLTIDEQAISTQQLLNYLRSSGKLGPFIGEVLRQYVIEKELQNNNGKRIDPEKVEQAIIEFRLNNQLSEPDAFHSWLNQNGLDFASFHHQVTSRLEQERLKDQLATSRLEDYFMERKLFLDRVVLSRIMVDSQELAEELRSQIDEGASFERLAQEYSLSEDRIVNGMMGPVGRGTLPDKLRAAIDLAKPGELLGPLELDNRFILFRVDKVLPASLEDEQLREILKNELFERWIIEKIRVLNVQLQLN